MQTICSSKGASELISASTGISQAKEHFPYHPVLWGWPPSPAAPHALGSVEEPLVLRRDEDSLLLDLTKEPEDEISTAHT